MQKVKTETQSKHLELAERCEKATGPDLELDLAIGEEVGSWPAQPGTFKFPLRYSRSLDAAMTLVPEGFKFNCGNTDGCWAQVSKPGLHFVENASEAVAATPALALCAAAIRARSA